AFESQIVRILNKLHHSLEKNDIRLTEHERREQIELEWKQTSIVLDRLTSDKRPTAQNKSKLGGGGSIISDSLADYLNSSESRESK
ncbi:unnamed protein product, partial [Acanthoscelides obtectus]